MIDDDFRRNVAMKTRTRTATKLTTTRRMMMTMVVMVVVVMMVVVVVVMIMMVVVVVVGVVVVVVSMTIMVITLVMPKTTTAWSTRVSSFLIQPLLTFSHEDPVHAAIAVRVIALGGHQAAGLTAGVCRRTLRTHDAAPQHCNTQDRLQSVFEP